MQKIFFPFLFFTICMTGCLSKDRPVYTPVIAIDSPTVTRSASPFKSATSLVLPTQESTVTPRQLSVRVASPLSAVPISALSEMIFNPFHLPAAGSDDPHQGIDFSDIDPLTTNARSGMEIHAILDGDVVAIIPDRFPYGNAVLIATAWQDLPEGWQELLMKEPIPAGWPKTSALSCPSGWDEEPQSILDPSLYILYAHMLNLPTLRTGEKIIAGDLIGEIGMSGNALAPHLHIEMRFGPIYDFDEGIVHYDVSASQSEMKNYCRWRISGWYRAIDPMRLLLLSTFSG